MRRVAVVLLALPLGALLAACNAAGPVSAPVAPSTPGAASAPSTSAPSTATAPPRLVPVIAAAGDIACHTGDAAYHGGAGEPAACRMRATAEALRRVDPTWVLPLGDLQYQRGERREFARSYASTWGEFRDRTKPVPGNHEYGVPKAAGYFKYFGSRAGPPETGWYSYDIGAWHVVALNSNCRDIGGCGRGSPQERWLRADLARSPARCTLAYWHHPRWSSGLHGDDAAYDAFWRALHDAGADVVLNGHDHHYERFAPQSPSRVADPARGVRQFVVGTGGRSLYPVRRARPHSEVRNARTFGVLQLTLHAASYDWEFVPVEGQSFTDRGSTRCH